VETVRSFVGFLDGGSEFVEVRFFKTVKVLLVLKGLSLILEMDSINFKLAVSECLRLCIVVISHLNFFDIGEDLVGTLNKEVSVSEFLVELHDCSLEIFLSELDCGSS